MSLDSFLYTPYTILVDEYKTWSPAALMPPYIVEQMRKFLHIYISLSRLLTSVNQSNVSELLIRQASNLIIDFEMIFISEIKFGCPVSLHIDTT